MQTEPIVPELPLIRPPSEWQSLLVRLTRGCRWNRCRFCGIYPSLGQPDFSVRSVEEVKRDIELSAGKRPRAKDAFFGDADPLEIGLDTFCELARHLRRVCPVERLTCYARASTLRKLKPAGIAELARAGLNRVHIGLESGDDDILRLQRKGQSAAMVEEVAGWLKAAGIEISFYVLLGLGSRDHWHAHSRRTAAIINRVAPEFVRVRRLWIYGDPSQPIGARSPLWELIEPGRFLPQSDEGTVHELRELVAHLDQIPTFLTCDHPNNYIRVAGHLDRDRMEMLAEIDAFLARPAAERQAHYAMVGSRI